jgi:hypothetical protein
MKPTTLFSALMVLASFARAEYVEVNCKGDTLRSSDGPVQLTIAHWISEEGEPRTGLYMGFRGVIVSTRDKQDANNTSLGGQLQVAGVLKPANYLGKIQVSGGTPSTVQVEGKMTLDKEEYPIKSTLTCNDGPESFEF